MPASPQDDPVAAHYGGDDLLDAIRTGLETLGKTSEVTVDDLAPVDEFHVGGRTATAELCDRLDLVGDSRVLDIGCGLGGTSRFIADRYRCRVTGVDITPRFVEIGRVLDEWTGLTDRVALEVGDATAMPFPDGAFDVAVQLHVGMNIDDKVSLFEEVHRVLEPGGRLAVYDIMRLSDGAVSFPVPWAGDESASFVDDRTTYRRALGAAGFSVTGERERGAFAVEFFDRLRQRSTSADGPPPLGLHLTMGSDAPVKIANMVATFRAGVLAPVEMLCRSR